VTCPQCGAIVVAADATCPNCQAMLAFTVPASAQPGQAALHANRPVRPVRGIGIVAMILTGLTLLVSLVFNVMTNLSPAVGGGTTSIRSLSPLVWVLTTINLAATIVTIVWLWRARKNVDAMVGTSPRWTAGWAIGAWCIPVANLVLIPLVIVDVVRNSMDERRARRTTAVVWAWAAVQLAGVLAVGGLAAAVPFAAGLGGQTRTAGLTFATTATIAVVGTALKIAYIAMISAGQHERIAPALGGPRRTRTLPTGPLAPVQGEHRPPSYG
jgi:hypothetical protein